MGALGAKKVYSTLTKSGTYLENPDDDRDVHTWVGVSDQELDADKKRELYDMRGKKGCFTVMMFGAGSRRVSPIAKA